MSLKIFSLASGSSGNAYLIAGEKASLLVDAGISGKQIKERLSAKGYSAEALSAVLITHEHSDHIKGIPQLFKLGLKAYATAGSFANMNLDFPAELVNIISSGESFTIGDITVESFALSHDAAEPVGYAFSNSAGRIAIVTDTGCVTEEIERQLQLADILVLESNHDENILRMGPYPWFLKQRILSELGHLSNEAAAKALAKAALASGKEKTVLLAHLSKENNFPEMALTTAENIILEQGVSLKKIKLACLSRSEAGEVYTLL